MNRYVDKDLGEVSECVLEQSFLGNPNRQVDGAQAKALGSAGGKSLAENGTGTLTEKVGEENKPISRRYHEEESSWLRRHIDDVALAGSAALNARTTSLLLNQRR